MDAQALADILEQASPRLLRLIRLRLSPSLAQRIDAEDVLQEVFVEAHKRLHHYAPRGEDNDAQRYVWLRLVALQTLTDLARHHVGAQGRSVKREQAVASLMPADRSQILSLSHVLASSLTSPSGQVAKAEEQARVAEAIDELSEDDRQILLLRHLEQLTNSEAAEVLDLKPAACGMRYLRALERLRKALGIEDDSNNS